MKNKEIKLACTVVQQVEEICDKHGNKPGELINVLHECQALHGYLPVEMQRIIARKLGIPASKVYGVVTFYSFFTMTPKGKHPISVCLGTACYVRGSERLLEEMEMIKGRIQRDEATPKDEDLLKYMYNVLEMYARGFDFAPIDILDADGYI